MTKFFINSINYFQQEYKEPLDKVASSRNVPELQRALAKTSLPKNIKRNITLIFKWGDDWDLHMDDDLYFYDDEHVGVGPSDPRYIMGMGGYDVPR